MNIRDFLKLMVDKNASDMFLTTGTPIYIKVEGKLYPVTDSEPPPGAIKQVAYTLMGDERTAQFERELEMNMALALPDVGRFRVNVFRQRAEVAMVIRYVRTEIPEIAELHLPGTLRDLMLVERGLILVVGATGSGKSTTLAAMLDHRNRQTASHILTIEDPIEYLHRPRKSVINQREVGFDTHSYAEALKNAMREAPNVIMIGEIRDTDTMDAAISFSETGHLCLATLHSNNADQTLARILNFFPESAHPNVLANLALNLKAVISQRLVTGLDGQRLPAVEILINTPLIADLIRRGHMHEIKDAMENSLQDGMQTFDQALYQLYRKGRIDLAEALRKADSHEGLALKVRLSEGGKDDSELAAFDMSGFHTVDAG